MKIFLYSDRVEFLATRKKTKEHQIFPCQQKPDDPSWQLLIELLLATLKGQKFNRDSITVVLSNSFVRYTLVPWSQSLAKPEDEETLARICFEKIYGEMKDWRLRIDDGKYGCPRIASAIPEAFFASIENTFKTIPAIELVSIQPFLMYAFNQRRGNFAEPDFIFGIAESNRICLASIHQGKWLGARSVYCATISDQATLVEREILATGLEPGTKVYWFADPAEMGQNRHAKMLPLHLDYRQKNGFPKKYIAVTFAIELLVGGYLLHQYQNIETANDSSKSILKRMTSNSVTALPAKESPEKLKAELVMATKVIMSLSLPWKKLLEGVEQSLDGSVALLSIQPDLQARTISITVEAKDYSSMVNYVKRLSKEPIVSSAHLLNHQVQLSDPQKPVRFSLVATLIDSTQ